MALTPAPSAVTLRDLLSQQEIDCLFSNAIKPPSDPLAPPTPLNTARAIELLELGADPETTIGFSPQSPLFIAAASIDPGALELTQALLRRGANPNRPLAKSGRTALHALINTHSHGMGLSENPEGKLRALAAAGADFNAQDEQGRSPLAELCFAGNASEELDRHHARLARLLVSLGADPNAPGPKGAAPFELAARDVNRRGGGLALLRELLDLGARVDEDCIARCKRWDPSEEFLLFISSLHDRLALEKSTPGGGAAPKNRL